MNKAVLTIILAVFSLSVFATGIEKDYVLTNEGINFYEDMNYGLASYLIAKKDEGMKVKYSVDQVLEYRKDGKVYRKIDLSVIENKTGQAFFELLNTRGGFNLYMHESFDVNGETLQSFYIFKDKEFVFELNDNNALQILSFFNRV